MKIYFIAIILALMAIAFTWHAVSWSEKYGKLAVPPDYDDSHSLVEGAVRLLNFQNSGLGAAWDEYRLRNPHSFLHYYWTAALFSVFGICDAVPYWANALFLFGVLVAFVSMLPRSLPSVWKLVWASAFLGVPVCFHVVFDYRSEVTMAALLFMGCACALEWSWGKKNSKIWFLATSVCFALALAMKPVMFPYQLGMLGLCSMVYLASRCITLDRAAKLAGGTPALQYARLWNGIAWLFGLWALVLLPSVPHFWIYRQTILGYILGVAFESDFYKLNEQQGAQWSFHWLGYSGVWHLGGMNMLFALILLIGLLLILLNRYQQIAPDARWMSLALLTCGAFGGIAINAVHQPWFGMTFQLLLTATALAGLAHFFKIERLSPWLPIFLVGILGLLSLNATLNRWFILAAILVCVFIGVLAMYFKYSKRETLVIICAGLFALLCWKTTQVAPYHNYVQRTVDDLGVDALEWRRTGARNVLEIISASWNSQRIPVIWCSSYGWVDGNTITWEAVKQKKAWKAFNKSELKKSTGELFPKFADFLVISNPKLLGYIKTPDSGHQIQSVSKLLLGHPSLNLVGEVYDPSGEKIAVIKNGNPQYELAPDWLKIKVQASDTP